MRQFDAAATPMSAQMRLRCGFGVAPMRRRAYTSSPRIMPPIALVVDRQPSTSDTFTNALITRRASISA